MSGCTASATARSRSIRKAASTAAGDLGRTHAGLRRIGTDEVTLERDGIVHHARRATFEYEEKVPLDALPSVAEIYLFCRATDAWQVEYRFTRPRELNAAPIIETFLHELPWTLHAG